MQAAVKHDDSFDKSYPERRQEMKNSSQHNDRATWHIHLSLCMYSFDQEEGIWCYVHMCAAFQSSDQTIQETWMTLMKIDSLPAALHIPQRMCDSNSNIRLVIHFYNRFYPESHVFNLKFNHLWALMDLLCGRIILMIITVYHWFTRK